MDRKKFIQTVWDYYHTYGRDLPWRHDTSPYSILVSEIMLQQTQVKRVLVKYAQFLEAFPSFEALHRASQSDVLRVWQGMGYNRRALWLKKIADIVVTELKGELPRIPEELVKLPGIGTNTAGSIAAFAYNYPSVFIETNIRRVYIFHFFQNTFENDKDVFDTTDSGTRQSHERAIHDKEILQLVAETLDCDNPREWYWALMDYGSYLASVVENPNRHSKHYTKQSKFEGSKRALRGAILKILLQSPKSIAQLREQLQDHTSYDYFDDVVEELLKERFITHMGEILAVQ